MNQKIILKSAQILLMAFVCLVTAAAQGSNEPAEISRAAIERIIIVEATAAKLDWRFAWAIALSESNFNRVAVSHKGARGVMQLMPETAARFGVRDSLDATQNIRGGVRYLKFLLDLFGGNAALAAAAYNAGEGAVNSYLTGKPLILPNRTINARGVKNNGIPPYSETQNYVQKVLKTYLQLLGVANIKIQIARNPAPQVQANSIVQPIKTASVPPKTPEKVVVKNNRVKPPPTESSFLF